MGAERKGGLEPCDPIKPDVPKVFESRPDKTDERPIRPGSNINALTLYISLLISTILPLNAAQAQRINIEEIRKRIQAELCEKRKCEVQFIINIEDIEDGNVMKFLQKYILEKLEELTGRSLGKENIGTQHAITTQELLGQDVTGNLNLTLDDILSGCTENPNLDATCKARLFDISTRIATLSEEIKDICIYIKAYKKDGHYDLRMIAASLIKRESVSLEKPIDLDRLVKGMDSTKEGETYENEFVKSLIELLNSLLNIAEGQQKPAGQEKQKPPQQTSENKIPLPQPQNPPQVPEQPVERSYGLRLTTEGAFIPKSEEPYFKPRFEADFAGIIPFSENHGVAAGLNYGVEQGPNHLISLSAGYRFSIGNLHLELGPEGVLRVSEADGEDFGGGVKGRISYEFPVAGGKVNLSVGATGFYVYIPEDDRHITGGTIGCGIFIPFKELNSK